jgi:putative addiction module component (TIGR02574 family)
MGLNVVWRIASDGSHMTTDQIEQELLKLPASDRARLAERLIASLDEDAEVEKAWAAEVRRRDGELESGAAEAIGLEDALASIRARYRW